MIELITMIRQVTPHRIPNYTPRTSLFINLLSYDDLIDQFCVPQLSFTLLVVLLTSFLQVLSEVTR